MPWKWYDSKVLDIQDIAPNTKQFWLQVDDPEPLDYQPGQFITLDLPIHEKRRNRWRSYSIANLPDASNVLELCIVRLEGGLASDYLFDQVKAGSSLTFKGPSGAFVLPREPKELVMVCTGTGIAPFRSMLLQLAQRGSFDRDVHLIFGTRYQDGILYREEMEALAIREPRFRYTVVLSREEAWTGYRGHVHQVYQEGYQEVRDDRIFLLCGWSMMIDEAVINLISEMGYTRRQVRYELYG